MKNKNYVDFKTFGIYYRQVQVLVILSNDCFQMFIWPIIQFFGASGIIAFMYSVIVFHKQIPAVATIIISLVMISTTLLCVIMLNMGSKPMLHSAQILGRTNQNGCIVTRKIFRSCPIISLRIGMFYKMDRNRSAAFIKFILQRTFILVLQTNIQMKSRSEVGVYLPDC